MYSYSTGTYISILVLDCIQCKSYRVTTTVLYSKKIIQAYKPLTDHLLLCQMDLIPGCLTLL